MAGQQRYLDRALLVLQQADANPQLALLQRGGAADDAAFIATGKAYQRAWNLIGVTKIHRATGAPELAVVVDRLWHSIRQNHLTLGGGHWGGVASRSREVFNAPGSFSPQAYVETCSTLAWIQLNGQLLQITGQARYADEIERSAYNDLLGAMALEELPLLFYGNDTLNPLSGVQVLDLSAYIAGPYGCTMLADQGAEVIKIEPPDGDNLRHYPSTLQSESRARDHLRLGGGLLRRCAGGCRRGFGAV